MQWNAIEYNETAQFRIEDDVMTRGGGVWRQQAFSTRGDGPAQAGASFFSTPLMSYLE
jgi:hypothetical protein